MPSGIESGARRHGGGIFESDGSEQASGLMQWWRRCNEGEPAMKTLVLANQKGGVGKTAIACQLGYFLVEQMKKRVMIIDLDHQGNTSKNIITSKLATVSEMTADRLLTEQITTIEEGKFVVIPAHGDLMKLERQHEDHNQFAMNLKQFLNEMDDRFDVAIIDTNPNPDIRVIASLVVGDFVLSPIQLNQEAVDGIAALRAQVLKIQSTLNKDLQFIGLLPNLVEPTPFQRANMEQLCAAFASLFIRLDDGRMAAIPSRTAMAEAQAMGAPIWTLQKTSSRDAWMHIKPIFHKVAHTMGVA
jgi:chromosome partitioning protein